MSQTLLLLFIFTCALLRLRSPKACRRWNRSGYAKASRTLVLSHFYSACFNSAKKNFYSNLFIQVFIL